MRLNIKLSPNKETLPFNYQHAITKRLHQWLGDNEYHDSTSMYSFSWIRGQSKSLGEGLEFTNGGHWFVSFWDEAPVHQLKNKIIDDAVFINGMEVLHIKEQATPSFKKKYRFKAASPILLRQRRDDGTRQHLQVADEKSDLLLTKRLHSKMEKAGISRPGRDVKVEFDKNYKNPKTKLIDIKGVKLVANLCPVIITGSPTALAFAWNVGVGELTGSGFGAIA